MLINVLGSQDQFSSIKSVTGENNYTLGFSTFLGGSVDEYGAAIATDGGGNVYITGDTNSSNFPMKYAWNDTFGGGYDAFVAKFSSSGQLIFSTYIGGSLNDVGTAIAVDNAGNIYVAGATGSSNFPLVNAWNSTHGGPGADVFLLKLNSTGDLVFSTFFGGSGDEGATAIALDNNSNIYITGYTTSPNLPMKSAYNKTYGGITFQGDAYLAKFSSAGKLVFSTYYGGSGQDQTNGIALDSHDNIYLTGLTTSTNLPLKNPWNSTFGSSDSQQGFLAEYDSTGGLQFSTYFGGNDTDSGTALAIDKNDTIIITGYTYSKDFPMVNPFNSTFGGVFDLFVMKFNSTKSLIYSSYVGGNNRDFPYGIALDSSGSYYITGQTNSTDFPMVNPYFGSFNGGFTGDAFIAKFNSSNNLVFSSFLGGSNVEIGRSIAVDNKFNCYIVGTTSSSNFPTSANGYYINYNGGPNDVFLTKFSSPLNGNTLSSTTSTLPPTTVTTTVTSTMTVTTTNISTVTTTVVSPIITNATVTKTEITNQTLIPSSTTSNKASPGFTLPTLIIGLSIFLGITIFRKRRLKEN